MSSQLKDHVWAKATFIIGHDSSEWRKDECGAWIKYSEYGNRSSQFGWEIDHIAPGGPTIIDNLRPLQWRNNIAKSRGKLRCAATAYVEKESHQNRQLKTF